MDVFDYPWMGAADSGDSSDYFDFGGGDSSLDSTDSLLLTLLKGQMNSEGSDYGSDYGPTMNEDGGEMPSTPTATNVRLQ